ncbi:MAG: hypothetical protein IT377_07330 [Polyangiaceae bacterium]|nr:hypothetical protein [Polyangiaceae bacterium]
MKKALRKSTEAWVAQFTSVPASVIQKMAKSDDAMYSYASPSLRLIASPTILCGRCLYEHDGDEAPLKPLESKDGMDVFEACENCGYDLAWEMREPSVFPCGWSTLFAPPSSGWFIDHADEIAKLGFFVFESEDYGALLGIDAAGFDFYEAYWIPLYKLIQS